MNAYELETKIRELEARALENYNKANAEEQKVYARREVIRQLEQAVHEKRAKAGNEISRVLLRSPARFDTVVDTRASADPIWKAHVANNQFYTRKADMDNQMLQNLYMQREQMLNAE